MAHGGPSAGSISAPGLPVQLRLNLSLMMFLEYAIWGAWSSVLGNRLTAMGLSDYIGHIIGTMALGSIFTPLFIGQVADRYFSSEKLMALLHLVGAGLLYAMASIPPVPGADPTLIAATASKFYWIALAYALVYSPTLALANSITFSHVPDATRDFPGIRVLGTIGWIIAGWTVGKGLVLFFPDPKTSEGPLLLGAVLSVALGLYSFFLPHTPPRGRAGDALPFLKAVRLLRDPSFALFFGVSFVITIVLAFYFSYTGVYLEKHIGVEDVASVMTIGQCSEIFFLLLLPWFLRRLGMKWVLAVGMLAWGVRYGIFAWGGSEPPGAFYWPVVLSLALHGICFDFFFAAGFIYVDNEAPNDIKSSAQSLFIFLTYGVAMWLGSELSNVVFTHFTARGWGPAGQPASTGVWALFDWLAGFWGAAPGQGTNWAAFWTLPSEGVLAALVVFVLFFHMRKQPAPTVAPPTPEPAWRSEAIVRGGGESERVRE